MVDFIKFDYATWHENTLDAFIDYDFNLHDYAVYNGIGKPILGRFNSLEDAMSAVDHDKARFCGHYCTNLLDPKERKCEYCRFFDCVGKKCNPDLFD